jgi:AcrR family transcriptional regulator
MTEKNYHHGDLRSALVQGARSILERDGLAALSLRATAREVGVSHAAPLHHFRNHAELLAAIAASGFEEFVRALDQGSRDQTEPLERLVQMGVAYVAFAQENPALYRVMFGSDRPNVSTEQLGLAMHAAWEQLFGASAAAAGERHALSVATLVWSVVHGHAMLVAAQCMPPLENKDKLLGQSLAVVAMGIRSLVHQSDAIQ